MNNFKAIWIWVCHYRLRRTDIKLAFDITTLVKTLRRVILDIFMAMIHIITGINHVIMAISQVIMTMTPTIITITSLSIIMAVDHIFMEITHTIMANTRIIMAIDHIITAIAQIIMTVTSHTIGFAGKKNVSCCHQNNQCRHPRYEIHCLKIGLAFQWPGD